MMDNNYRVTLELFDYCQAHKVPLMYASSAAVYGAGPHYTEALENEKPLNVYGYSKFLFDQVLRARMSSLTAQVVGLRYFNVFGKRQDPEGAYAAVIPKWIAAMIKGEEVVVNGDGETSRDFCFVDNAVQANILAAVASTEGVNQVYNVAVNARTSLNDLHHYLASTLSAHGIAVDKAPRYQDFRAGDVRHSQADISKAKKLLGYHPLYDVLQGLEVAMPWYTQFLR
jgi:UDP-N-acetylglucosamine 4-epimerase